MPRVYVTMSGVSKAQRSGESLDRLIQGERRMKCPTCGIGNLVVTTRKLPYSYKGKSTVIKAVKGKFCNNLKCREVVLDIDEAAHVSKEMLAFNKEVNPTTSGLDEG